MFHLFVFTISLVGKLSFMTILCHFGSVTSNIHVTLDHFPVTLDISYHFGQCHKRPYFLLVFGCLSSAMNATNKPSHECN